MNACRASARPTITASSAVHALPTLRACGYGVARVKLHICICLSRCVVAATCEFIVALVHF
eukprot:6750508-Lingulodinium_polyedra.AAC.1